MIVLTQSSKGIFSMTMIDSDQVPDYKGKKRPTIRSMIKENPSIAVFRRTKRGQLEAYVYMYGQRLSLIPQDPQELFDWCSLYADDPLTALRQLGLKLPGDPKLKK